MDSSPAPLPVQLPGHFTEEQLVVTDKLVDFALHSDPIPSNQITIPRPLHNLKTNAFWDGPLSPQTVQNVLTGHENLAPAQLWALVTGLTTTIQQRETIYNSKASHFQKHLADINTECQALKQHIQDIDGELLLCPNGYEDNNGRLPLLTIPGPDGDHPAVFIKQLDNGRVVGLSAVARGEHDAHIINLFAAPALDEQPLEPLPHWFCACLWGNTTDFHPLHEAIITLNDWGILAEVQQY